MGTALVTGASSGLGEEFCWQLAAASHDLVLVARRREVLEGLADRLRWIAGVDVEVVAADLSLPDDVERVARRLDVQRGDRSGLAPVGLLVNNAGFGLRASFLQDDVEREQEALDVMVRAVMVLSQRAGRAMLARGRGAILNVGSVAADTGMGTYSAHKAWVRAFTEGLAAELARAGRGTGARVTSTVVMPGLTRTHFHAASGRDLSGTPQWIWSTPEQVVTAALDAARRGRVVVTPTARYAVAGTVARIAPRGLVREVVQRLPHT